MADISRRSFVVMTAGGVLIPGNAGADSLEHVDDQRKLHAILANAHHADDDAKHVYLVEYPTVDGAWSPSARLFRGSSPLPASITATPDRWRLSNGQRLTMLDRNFTVSVERKSSGTKKMP
jgi:hypothetical protein